MAFVDIEARLNGVYPGARIVKVEASPEFYAPGSAAAGECTHQLVLSEISKHVPEEQLIIVTRKALVFCGHFPGNPPLMKYE